MSGLGYGELIVLLLIVVVLFGAKRIPELAKSLGSSLSAFKTGLKQEDDSEPKD